MGCAPSKAVKGVKLPQYNKYIQVKDKVFSSPKFIFIKFFYQDLYFVAENIIKIAKNFDSLVNSFDVLKTTIQQFQAIPDISEVAQVLAVIPEIIQPMVKESKEPIFRQLYSAKNFAQKYHDFQDDLFVLFKLLSSIERARITEPKGRYQYAIHILNCLDENLQEINDCDYDKQSLAPFKKLIKLINPVKKIMGLVTKLSKYLTTKVMGISVMSLLSGGSGGFKKTIVKMAIKGLCIPIKAAIKKLVPKSAKIINYEFQCSFKKPQSGWLHLHYAYDKKGKKLDLFNCISKQWAQKNLGQLYKNEKIKQYQPIRRSQLKFDDQEQGKAEKKSDFEEAKIGDTNQIGTKNQNSLNEVNVVVNQDNNNQDDINQQDREEALKEVEKSINNIVQEMNVISRSIRDSKEAESYDNELQWDESDPEIDDERNQIVGIPLEKRKKGVGSVLNKSLLLIP